MTGRFDALVAWVWQPVKWRICPQKWDFQGRWILLPLRFEAFRYELHQVLDWILKHQLLASRRCNTCRGLPSWTNGNCLDYCIRWTLETLLRFYFRKHSTACDGVFDHWCFHRWCILACRQILYVHRRPVVLPRTDALGISVCFCWAFRGVYFCRNLYTIHMIVISQKNLVKYYGVPICDRVSSSWVALLRFCVRCLLDEMLMHFDHVPSWDFRGPCEWWNNSYYGTLEKNPTRPFWVCAITLPLWIRT